MTIVKTPEKTSYILKNSAVCLDCGEEVESKTVHDFRTCECGRVSVDGGKEYLRRVGNPEDFKDASETLNRKPATYHVFWTYVGNYAPKSCEVKCSGEALLGEIREHFGVFGPDFRNKATFHVFFTDDQTHETRSVVIPAKTVWEG